MSLAVLQSYRNVDKIKVIRDLLKKEFRLDKNTRRILDDGKASLCYRKNYGRNFHPSCLDALCIISKKYYQNIDIL